MKSLLFSLTIALAITLCPRAEAVDFKTDIRPIFQKHCFKCHGGPRPKGKLAFDDEDRLLKRIGEDEEAAIVPGDAMASLLVKKVTLPPNDSDAMPPPTRGEPLNNLQIDLIKKWIDQGASLEKGTPSEEESEEMAEADDTLYTWTNDVGQSLQAKFISLQGENVVLAKEDGSQFPYPLAKLSAESQAQAKKLGGG